MAPPPIPSKPNIPRRRGARDRGNRRERLKAMQEYWDQLHQSMQPIPPRLVPTPIPGSGPYQGASHPGPQDQGSQLLDALMRRMQAIQQGLVAQEQARIQEGPRIMSDLAHAASRADIPTNKIAEHYRRNVEDSFRNTGGTYDPRLPGGPGNTLLGTDIPDAFENFVRNSPLMQQLNYEAALRSGDIEQPLTATFETHPVPGTETVLPTYGPYPGLPNDGRYPGLPGRAGTVPNPLSGGGHLPLPPLGSNTPPIQIPR